jgi:hypothetical protein
MRVERVDGEVLASVPGSSTAWLRSDVVVDPPQ